jgi:hypothetical protein
MIRRAPEGLDRRAQGDEQVGEGPDEGRRQLDGCVLEEPSVVAHRDGVGTDVRCGPDIAYLRHGQVAARETHRRPVSLVPRSLTTEAENQLLVADAVPPRRGPEAAFESFEILDGPSVPRREERRDLLGAEGPGRGQVTSSLAGGFELDLP